jgi:DNA polymerase III delta subunit
MQQARRSDALTLQRQLERILEADLAIKRGQGDERVTLQMLVTELAAPRPRAAGPARWR